MNDIGFVFLLVVVMGLSIASWVWHESRADELVESWAKANGFRLLNVEKSNFLRGPYFWNSSKGQVVFRVRVEDSEGKIRSGYLRCGSYWGGMWSDETDVHWD